MQCCLTMESETKNILIVEDNLLNQKIAGFLIKGLGYRFDVASDGKQAIEKLKNGGFDLVLMDIQMPVMDGYEATALIRNELKLEIPIIATAGQTGDDEKEKCISGGMTDYILKPLKGDEINALIAKHLGLKSS